MALASGVGLISGLPVNDIIGQLLALRQRPIFNLQDRIAGFQNQQASYVLVNNALLDLRSAASALSSASTFEAKSAFSTDESAFDATVTADASAGTYDIEILQLAAAHRLGAQGFADEDSTAVASADGLLAFKIGSGGEISSVAVDSSTTLADLRDRINALDAGVRASIINDGSDTNPYRLVLTSDETGADNEIFLTQNDTTLNFATATIEDAVADIGNTFAGTVTTSGTYTGTDSRRIVVEVTEAGATGTAKFRISTDGGVTFGPDSEFTTSETSVDIGDGVEIAFSADTFAVGDRFTVDVFAPEIEQAQDAILRVDGVTISRDTNSVADAIEGVTLDLHSVTSSAENLTVSRDTESARGQIVTFVAQYNEVMNQIAAATAFDAESEIRGPLLGDSTIRSVQRSLADVVISPIPGLSNNEINSLAGVGISVTRDGLLEIDDAELSDAIDDNLDAVQKMFATVGAASTSRIDFVDATSATEPGTYTINLTQAAEQAVVLSNQDVTGPLSNTEILTFTVDDTDHSVTIAAGSTLDEAIEIINTQLDQQGVDIAASREGDRLRLATNAYGFDAEIEVASDQGGASANQLGIGTTARTDTGQDVAGTIGGHTATGSGQTLTGAEGTPIEDLVLTITETVTGNIGSITVSTGVGIQFETLLDSLADSDGLLQARQDGLGDSIDNLSDQIEKIEASIIREEGRLRAQFASLETILAQFSQTSTFLSQQLAQLSNLTTGRSRS